MKRMLFNATQAEELRVAIVDGQKLIDIDIESAGRESRKSNIYKGVVTRVEPSLEACFVNYGEERHGFLPFKEIARSYFKDGTEVSKARIQDAIAEGDELIVQVDKEERGNKGAALTTFISLAGRYLVVMPNNPRGGGVSRRIEGEERQELREAMDQLRYPSGMSLIARTAGIGRSAEELQWDLDYLLQLWSAIEGAAGSAAGPFLIYQESSLVIRAIRDYFSPDIGEILIDTDEIHEQAHQFMSHVMPDMVHRVKRYQDDIPLYSRFQIEHQVETAYARLVPLPSGGAIVIDHTEALVAIDVNSARATKGSDIEETALRTNLEAADEAARQMRLRDLGGLIVIDFIDMDNARSQREVELRLKEALHYDRARVQAGKISRFGLMELSRQRLRPALNEGTHITCPRCIGTGVIRDVESAALHVLRVIQEEAMKENTAVIHAQVPVDVATYLLNEKRGEITKLEARLKVEIILIPDKFIETPHYRLERLRHDDERLATYQASYAIAEGAPTESPYLADRLDSGKPRQEAIVKGIVRDSPAPTRQPAPSSAPVPLPVAAGQATGGIIGRFITWLTGKAANEETGLATPPAAPAAAALPAETQSGGSQRQRSTSRRGGDSRRGTRSRSAQGQEAPAETRSESGRGRGRRGARNENERGESPARQAEAAQDAAPERTEDTAEQGREPRSRGRRGRRGGEARTSARSEVAETGTAAAAAAVATEAAGEAARTPASADAVAPSVRPPRHAEASAAAGDVSAPADDAPAAQEGRGPDVTDTDASANEDDAPRRKPRRRRGSRRARDEGATSAEQNDPATSQDEAQAASAPQAAADAADAADESAASTPVSSGAADVPAAAVNAANGQPASKPTAVAEPAPADKAQQPKAADPSTAASEETEASAQVSTVPAAEPVTPAGAAVASADDISAANAAEARAAEARAAEVDVASAPEPVDNGVKPSSAAEAAGSEEPATALVETPKPEPAPDLQAVVAAAGLQMIETSSTAQVAEPDPIVVPPRKPRRRKPAPAVPAEPMQQIETRADQHG